MRFFTCLMLTLVSLSLVIPASAWAATVPTLEVSPTEITAAAGQTFTTQLIIDTASVQAGGVGAHISFDPSIIQVVEVATLPVFDDYPLATYDNDSGVIRISGIADNQNSLFSGREAFAEVTWQAQQNGTSPISYTFTPGSTTDSNIAILTGNGDALEDVIDGSVTINGSAASGTGGSGGLFSLLTSEGESTAGTTSSSDQSKSLISRLVDTLTGRSGSAPSDTGSTGSSQGSTGLAATGNQSASFNTDQRAMATARLVQSLGWLVLIMILVSQAYLFLRLRHVERHLKTVSDLSSAPPQAPPTTTAQAMPQTQAPVRAPTGAQL